MTTTARNEVTIIGAGFGGICVGIKLRRAGVPTLSAQARYAAGVREILECWFDKRPIRDEYLIVQAGKLAGAGAHSYDEGNTTKGSEDAVRYKKS